MGNTLSTNVSSQIKDDYLSYSLASLSRSIPDLYDGLIPSRRRLLQTMFEEGFLPHKPYVKCARTTGITSANLHPHGSAYGSLISMATPWANNVPWVDCHGNIGSSVDGPAAERYVENRLRSAAIDILLKDSDTWDTKPNYDNSRREAIRFNSSLPTVLLNGDVGISVGYSTKLAPHNLQSIVDATKLLCKTVAHEKTYQQNLEKAREMLVPDFPTGSDIVEDEQLKVYLRTGSGSIRCRAKVSVGTQKREGRAKDRVTLTFTCLPPGVNPEKVGDQIRDELERGRIEGVAEVNDLSDLTGDCIEIVGKPGVDASLLQGQIYTYTDLDTKYSAKTLVMSGLKPVELSPVEVIEKWIEWRLDRLQEKFSKELSLKEDRAHTVQGLLKAIDKMDSIIKKIRASKDKAEAKASLMASPFKFTDRQAEAILEMKLRQLTNLDKTELSLEANELEARISELETLSSDETKGINARRSFLTSDLSSIAKKYGGPRKSSVISASFACIEAKKTITKLPLSKPRFLKIDMRRGVVEASKGPRGALILEKTDKLITLTEDGTLKKLPPSFKGALGNGYSPVLLAKKECEVVVRRYLTVFELDGSLRAMVLEGESLTRATSKGKALLPEGAKLLHFGEGPYDASWALPRNKKLTLDLSVKVSKPGSKGTKVTTISRAKTKAGNG